jgi:diguanylate cyclase (GGDEF)-like protein/PAS domain S-box-containing protein
MTDIVGIDVTASAVAWGQQAEAHERGLAALAEVSRQVSGSIDLSSFFGALSASVAQLVGARRVFFGRLRKDGWLESAGNGYGIDPELLASLRAPCHRGGTGLAERIVFDGLVFHSVLRNDPELAAYREVIEALQLEEVMAVAWRGGDDALGILVVDGPLHGSFAAEDTFVLRTAAFAAGLVWQLRGGNELVNDLLEAAPDAMLVIGADGRMQLVNVQLERLFGYDRAELYGQPVELLLPEAIREIHRRYRDRYVADPHPRTMGVGLDLAGRRKDGGEFPVDVSLSPLSTDTGVLVVAAIRDVTRRRQNERARDTRMAELADIAITDWLTGLVNRREFERLLLLPRSEGFAILGIDVDGLKIINDAHGHDAGDAHLRAIARTLRMALRDHDVVARTGGDEFAALLPGRTEEAAVRVAERLRQAMHGVVVPHGFARISVGCASGSLDADPLAVWAAADEALYRAKEMGRDRVEASFVGAAVASSLRTLERTLPAIIAEERVHAAYQPIVWLGGGSVFAYEALGRRTDEPVEAGAVELFAAAERSGVYRDLDWLCRRVAVQDARNLPPDSVVFVNVGVSSLLDPVHGVDQMLLLLRWGALSPTQIVLEITEREAVRDIGRLADVLGEYRRAGFRFAVDDVGEGHSTLEVLAAAVPEFVKVSATMTRHTDTRGARAVIHALRAFVEETGTLLIAEGLETPDDVARMVELGVPLGQGYALGMPAIPPGLPPGGTRDIRGRDHRLFSAAPGTP